MKNSQAPNSGKITIVNGSCTIDRMNEQGDWETQKVVSAQSMPKGMYYMNQVPKVDPKENTSYEGLVAFVGKSNVFAFQDGKLLKHDRSVMNGLPQEGSTCRIRYQQGQSTAVDVPKHQTPTTATFVMNNKPRT